MWSPLPLVHVLRKRLAGIEPRSLDSVAIRTWEISPAEESTAKPARFLPGQLERVTEWERDMGGESAARSAMAGGIFRHLPTRGFLIEDAWLIDGVLYKGWSSASHLKPRSRRVPKLRVEVELERGAVYCTYHGNRFFGTWLHDDCLLYPLAAAEGIAVTTDQTVFSHQPGYEARLGMKPARLGGAYFRELVIFSDKGQNRSKRERARANREKVLAHVDVTPHPGVFILRGLAGERRFLHNELELAEGLRKRRGFRVLDAMTADVPSIVATCAGARVVIGVEGSQLMHGILVLPEGGAVLTLQPPNRFNPVYKHLGDRDGHQFGFVVGQAEDDGFRIDPEEVERTLDLFLR
jgi:hypothetical protein